MKPIKRGRERSPEREGSRNSKGLGRQVQGNQSIELGGVVLRALVHVREALPLRDISAGSGITKGKARRYLLSFTRIGLVEQDEDTGFYRLGPLAIQLGLSAIAGLDVARLSTPVLAELRRATHETAVLAIWTENGPTVLRFEESRRPITLNVRVGSSLPMTISATGLLFGAFLDSEVVKARVADELASRRPGTPTRAAYEGMLEEVRRRGLARVEGTLLPGVSSIGAPVYDHRGRLAAALMVVGHQGIMDTSWQGLVAKAVAAAAEELSRRLGKPQSAA